MTITYNPNANVANVGFAGAVTRSATINGVTAGNALICMICHVDLGGGTRTLSSCSDGQGSYTTDATLAGNACSLFITSLFNANSGSHTVTVTVSGSGTNSNGHIYVVEVAGIGTSDSFDKTASSTAISTAMSTGATATLSSNNEIAFAIHSHNSSGGNSWSYPPTGFTNIHNGNDGGTASYNSQNYQIVSSNAAITADWGTGSVSTKHTCLVATYQAAIGGFLLSQLSNQGGF
jgi:hypothetical protein